LFATALPIRHAIKDMSRGLQPKLAADLVPSRLAQRSGAAFGYFSIDPVWQFCNDLQNNNKIRQSSKATLF
jgi:hypothetical protein